MQARLGRGPSDDDIESVVTFAYDLAEADRDFSKRRQIVQVLDVRGILAIEDGEKVCHASFILTGENTKRLTLPKRGKSLSIASTSSGTGPVCSQISRRLSLAGAKP